MSLTKAIKREWLARLGLTFSHSVHGTQLARTKRVGPLSIQKAFYPEGRDCAHIYLLHPPAGIVSGDVLQVDLHLPPQAHVLVTTPGANRFYRARHDSDIGHPEQKQITEVECDSQAKCENFPLETIVYDGAQGINHVKVNLKSDSVYLGWDISCMGLPSSEQPFKQGKFSQLNQVFCDDKLIYHDRIVIKPENQLQQHMAGLANNSVFSTFLAYAPETVVNNIQQTELIEQLRACIEQHKMQSLVSVTHINQLLIMRYLGAHAEECKGIFIELWRIIRPLYIQKKGIEPRIWHT